MSGHTPGPWRYQYVGEIDFRAPDPDDFCILSDDRTCTATSWGGRWDQGEANARLIAAAPDLLNALTVLADAAESMGIPCDAARAAIAKATGAQP